VSNDLAIGVARIAGRRNGVWVNRAAVDVDQITERRRTNSVGPMKLLATGRLVWQKGFEYLLCALARVAKRGVAFHAEIVGEGELFSSLRFSIGDLGLEKHVTLAGALTSSEVLARMQATDVFLLSSVAEGISNAALEAMASGVPVVTTAAGGMPEAVADGVEGFVVPVRDIAALADRITRLAADPDLRYTLGHAARLRAEREFSLARQADVFESIYRSIARAA
jgi:glycosyltransferase involved in cell wall biosynthesis